MENPSELYDNLNALLSIDSVKSEKTPSAPFGEGVKAALRFFLGLAESFGFDTVNYDDYCGEVTFGEGQEIGIIGHLDVVPVGEGWTYPPFALTKDKGYLIGRGIADDKGPMLLCLYALKALKDSGVKCNKKFRLFVGCDEETGWQDVEYLNTKTNIPTYGFSPDGDFPVGYAEKGVFYVRVPLPRFKNFKDLKGGTVINAVCAAAQVTVFNKELLSKYDYSKYGLILKGDTLYGKGVAAHGSAPHLGKNAFLPILEFMKDCGEDVGDIIDYLFYDKWGLSQMENEQGKITLSPDIVKNGELICDCRVPAPFTEKDLAAVIKKAPFTVTAEMHHVPVMVLKDGTFVNTLLSAYNAYADKKGKPISMGGSTFARVFEKGCAFGPEFPEENNHIHEADERIKETSLMKMYEIYKKALFDLATLQEEI